MTDYSYKKLLKRACEYCPNKKCECKNNYDKCDDAEIFVEIVIEFYNIFKVKYKEFDDLYEEIDKNGK